MYGDNDRIRQVTETPSDLSPEGYRTDYRRDYARIVHSHSFRRLQGKQQLYPGLESDFFRSRLTHSLEVAQIAKSIGLRLNSTNPVLQEKRIEINTDILEVAGLAHDIGHPPFGHKGERALDTLMKGVGGFEGNAQTIRVLTKLEKKIPDSTKRVGLNLTSRSIASVLKYDEIIPVVRQEKDKLSKGYYNSDAELIHQVKMNVLSSEVYPKNFQTVESQIMDLADDIAYSVFDFEDGLKAGFYTLFDFIYSQEAGPDNIFERIAKKLSERDEDLKGIDAKTVFRTIEELIYFLLGRTQQLEGLLTHLQTGTDLLAQIKATNAWYYKLNKAYAEDGYLRTQSSSHLVGKFIRGIEFEYDDKFPQLSKVKFKPDILLQVETLKIFVYEFITNSPRIQISEIRGFDIVTEIFKIISDNPKLLPKENYKYYMIAKDTLKEKRIICDFVSGMTDRFAIEFYGRFKSMEPETIFKQYG
jgi:dGTPase